MFKVTCFNDTNELSQALANRIREDLAAAPGEPHALLLPGGRTPLKAYSMLINEPCKTDPKTSVLLTDERMVPMHSPESNWVHMSEMMDFLKVSPANRYHINTAVPAQEAAYQYHDALNTYINKGGRIEIGFLGLGGDGHTASLFTEEDLERGEGQYAVEVHRTDGLDGVSVTPLLLSKVKKIIFVVAGKRKKKIVKQLLENPGTVIAGKAVARNPSVELWMDSAADPF